MGASLPDGLQIPPAPDAVAPPVEPSSGGRWKRVAAIGMGITSAVGALPAVAGLAYNGDPAALYRTGLEFVFKDIPEVSEGTRATVKDVLTDDTIQSYGKLHGTANPNGDVTKFFDYLGFAHEAAESAGLHLVDVTPYYECVLAVTDSKYQKYSEDGIRITDNQALESEKAQDIHEEINREYLQIARDFFKEFGLDFELGDSGRLRTSVFNFSDKVPLPVFEKLDLRKDEVKVLGLIMGFALTPKELVEESGVKTISLVRDIEIGGNYWMSFSDIISGDKIYFQSASNMDESIVDRELYRMFEQQLGGWRHLYDDPEYKKLMDAIDQKYFPEHTSDSDGVLNTILSHTPIGPIEGGVELFEDKVATGTDVLLGGLDESFLDNITTSKHVLIAQRLEQSIKGMTRFLKQVRWYS